MSFNSSAHGATSTITSLVEVVFTIVLLALGIFWTVYLLNEVLLLRKRYRGASYIQDADSSAKRYEYWVQGVKSILLIFILLAENLIAILGFVNNAIPYSAFNQYPQVIISSYINALIDFGTFFLNILTLFLIEVYNNRTKQLPYKVKVCIVFSVAKLGLFIILSSIPPLTLIVRILLVFCITANTVWYSCNSLKLIAALNREHARILGEDAAEAQKMKRNIIVGYKRFTVLLMIALVLIVLYAILQSSEIILITIQEHAFNNFFFYEITFPQEIIDHISLTLLIARILMSLMAVFFGLPLFILPYILITCKVIYQMTKKRIRCGYGSRNSGSTLEQRLI